jgi:hypothetical protein
MNLLPGTSEEALVALVNEANPAMVTPLAVGDLYFGKVKQLSGGLVEIPAVAMYDSAFEGYVKFQYKRLDLSKAFGSVRPILRDIGYPSLHQLLPVINRNLGTSLTEEDVINTDIQWLGNNEQLNIQVTASASSLGYEGTFIILFTRVRPLLSKVVVERNLTVLKHPESPNLAKKSLSMHMYAIDFTDNVQDLAIYWTGVWWRYPSLKEVMRKQGFDNWPQGGRDDVKSYLTKNRPEANQAFKNVIIQRAPLIEGFTGDAYFHYNPV